VQVEVAVGLTRPQLTVVMEEEEADGCLTVVQRSLEVLAVQILVVAAVAHIAIFLVIRVVAEL